MIYQIKNDIEKALKRMDAANIPSSLKQEGTVISYIEQAALLTHHLHLLKYGNTIPYSYADEAIAVLQLWADCLANSGNEIGAKGPEGLKKLIMKDMESKPFYKTSKNPTFLFIDLFAGIGGFRMALQNEGGVCVFSSEFDDNAQMTYYENYGEIPFGDITLERTKSYIPDSFDILCGGFPCQPFSICGKKKGFEDTRGTLFFDVCQILDKHKPKVCFLENVQHLTKHDHGNTFRVIIDSLINLGYNVTNKILNSKDFGLPQFRERIFIVGSRSDLFLFSAIKKSPIVSMESFLDTDGDFEYLEKDVYTLLPNELVKIQAKSGLKFVGYRNKGQWKKGVRPNTEHLSRVHRQPNRIYSIEGTHPTLPSQETSGRFWIYIPKEDKVRKLTINECYRFMGYPANFVKHSSIGTDYKQLGNSVAIPVISAIIKEILKQELLTKPINYEITRGHTEQLTFDF